LDVASFGIPVGQAIGRWGNFFNQELYGKPTDWPWGVYISMENRLAGYEVFERFQPLFLYESLLNWALFGTMLMVYLNRDWVVKKISLVKRWRVGEGRFMGMYLVGYGVIRFMLEPMRIQIWRVGGVPTAQLVAAGLMVLGGYMVMRKSQFKIQKSK